MPKGRRIKSPQMLWEAASSVLVNAVESLFFRIGVTVAIHPWKTIIASLLFVLLSCAGLLRFHLEKNPMKLWVPPESDFYLDTNWYIDTFSTAFRLQRIIVTADDVLQPDVLKTLHNITNEIKSIHIDYNGTKIMLNDLCFKVPVVNFFKTDTKNKPVKKEIPIKSVKSNTTSAIDFTDPTLWVDDEFYCGFLEEFQLVCLQYNILDLWSNDIDELNNATKHDIVNRINNVKVNPTTGHPTDFTELFGGAKLDSNGDIVAANSIILTWYTQVNMSEVDLNEVGNLVGTEDWVSVPLSLWEVKFLEYLESVSQNSKNIKVFYESGRSFGDISGQAMFNDMDKLFTGILLMFFYVLYGLSRCNWLEIKMTLAGVGLFYVGLAYVSAVSWCSLMGISFGPVHSSLPFLLMGLGIDDMFVMSACWNNLTPAENAKSLPIRIGLMLRHAGVSIVITSFTDIVALLVGAITILPSLKSFCIYAAAGVFFIFCFSVTFYVAVLTLDVKRVKANRNGVLFCYKHKSEIRVSSSKTILQSFFEAFYKQVVFTIPGRCIVLLFVLISTGFSIQAVLRLEQRFDPKWFVPDDTYYKQFLNAYDYYYPEVGDAGMIFLGEMNYTTEFPKLYNMVQEFKNDSDVRDVVAWVDYFYSYILHNFNKDISKNATALTEQEFKRYLSRFLFSPIGGRFKINFKFEKEPVCGVITSNIKATTLTFRYPKFHDPHQYIPAMNRAKYIVKSTNITTGDGYRSVWSKVFGNWVTDEIIAVEVERNIELALLCVMICTVILITNLQMCVWIFLCVLLTIINVLGFMQRWDMTVDIVCCIGLELAIGLCVDYAAHVGHTFLTVTEGTRTERAFKTVTSIGTAVLMGGGATLLSLSFLSMSKAYTFQSFFKIFLLVILFGLFNGLMFLPVALSLVGPGAYKPKEEKELTAETVELNGKHDGKPPKEAVPD